MKILKLVVVLTLVCVVVITVYWLTESDVWVKPNKVVIVSQKEGDSISIDVPAENYAEALSDFTMKTQVKNKFGAVVKETDTVQYDPNIRYEFVTYSQLTKGRYEAHVIIGYQLNPIRSSELELPLAIIYVENP